jgi:hypothetical protein
MEALMDKPKIGDIVYYQLVNLKLYLVAAIKDNQSVVELRAVEGGQVTSLSYNTLLSDDWKKLEKTS